jgi:hypothetical protein
MCHYNSLREPAATIAEAENAEEITVLAELEPAFGENPTTSDGERHTLSLNEC